MDAPSIETGLRPASAAETLGRRIVTGDITPGTTLPNIEQLAVEFSMSRLSMREAIKLLAGKGLVSSAPRRGTIVRPRNEWSRLDPEVLVWQVAGAPDVAFVRNLFELRRMIEPEAAALTAVRAKGELLTAIETAYAQMADADGQAQQSIKGDVAFHQAILRGTGNEFIAALAPAIETSLMLTFSVQRNAWPDPANFLPSHYVILKAIKQGDPELARKQVQALLVRAEADALDGVRLRSRRR